MPRWAPEWGASLSRREGLRPPSRATTRIESGLGASFGAHSRQQTGRGAQLEGTVIVFSVFRFKNIEAKNEAAILIVEPTRAK